MLKGSTTLIITVTFFLYQRREHFECQFTSLYDKYLIVFIDILMLTLFTHEVSPTCTTVF